MYSEKCNCAHLTRKQGQHNQGGKIGRKKTEKSSQSGYSGYSSRNPSSTDEDLEHYSEGDCGHIQRKASETQVCKSIVALFLVLARRIFAAVSK